VIIKTPASRITATTFLLLALAGHLALPAAAASGSGQNVVKPTSSETKMKSNWAKDHLLQSDQAPPFSFVYHGTASGELLRSWNRTKSRRQLDRDRVQHTQIWTDPATGLQVRCVAVEYLDFPVVEWTVYLKNAGAQDTPLLEKIQGLDTTFERGAEGEFVLRGIKGDFCSEDSYAPYTARLTAGLVKKFSPPDSSGKSCDGPEGWPYYNLQMPGGGVILAIGWPGQWASSFERDSTRTLRVKAGQAVTHLSLKSGEEVRTPLMALLFWRGNDIERSQNLWRRWYMAHNLPRIQGEPQPPATQIQVDGSVENISAIKAALDAGIRPDICWRDAGGSFTWYPSNDGPYKGNDAWLNTGTWEIDPAKYPKGFKPFSEWVRSQGMQFLLWFEPERVGDPHCWLAARHPDWLLPGSSHGSILNLGNPAARSWLVNHINELIRSQGLDWYREDMNGGGPLPAWRRNDSADRQGLTENLYVQGHLAFWDELRRQNPRLHIDSCASGGRRNDLETMRRAVPLLRSDFQFPEMKHVVEGNQGHTYGLSSWLPFQGTGCYFSDTYALRSFYLPAFGTGGISQGTMEAQKKAYVEAARIAPLMLCDYYPLTPYSLQPDHWIAWQFNRPERGDGVVQAFRRSECPKARLTCKLRGLTPKARYEITSSDLPGKAILSGEVLMEEGLEVEIGDTPGAALVWYRIVKHR